ncbi:MAG: hypothetical protein BroJett039_05490 [Chloroflexota bacterium]|nr:MAG: hypothetical protein BroJett039_05490 [Chloroflexota bacterium]
MWHCHVCGSTGSHQEFVNEVFDIDQRAVLVEKIPARVCDRCGEITFSRETTESVRRLVHGHAKPQRVVELDVFAYH